MRATTSEMRGALQGADYPARRDALIEVAEENDANDDVLEDLHGLDEGEYESAEEVLAVLGEDA